jgi:hypothetical protein
MVECLWIDKHTDALVELKEGRSPYHCTEKQVEGKSYCRHHCAIAYLPQKAKAKGAPKLPRDDRSRDYRQEQDAMPFEAADSWPTSAAPEAA